MKKEHLPGKVQVKGTMLLAHLELLTKRVPDRNAALKPHLPDDIFRQVSSGVFATAWIPLKTLVVVDRAIAAASGGNADQVFHELGRHSAVSNLSGVYKSFVTGEPHRFFEKQARLHNRFQDFGRSVYEVVGPNEGRLTLEEYIEYSPVFCSSAVGYYVGALETMKAPGPIVVQETKCVCSGDGSCLFQIRF